MFRRHRYYVVSHHRWRRWLRRPSVHWTLMGLLAIATVFVFTSAARQAEASRRAWGASRTLVVARHRLATGRVITPDDVELKWWPEGLVPDGYFTTPPIGHTVRTLIGSGEPLVRDRVAPEGLSGVAAL